MTSNAEFLRSLAQNDYNIDGHLLPDGEQLMQIASHIEALENSEKALYKELQEIYQAQLDKVNDG